jgi:hypothetical protein
MTRSDIIRIQRTINDAGLGPVVVDGIYGPRTEAAYAELLRYSEIGGYGNDAPVPPAAKPWWTSRAQVGWLLAVGLNLLSRWLGVELDADAWIPPILEVLSGISALVGLYGNAKRDAPIDPTLVAPGLRLPARGMPDHALPPGAHKAARSKQARHDDFWGNGGLGGFGND